MRLEISVNLFLLVYGQKKGNKRNKIFGEWDAEWDTCDAECGGGFQVKTFFLKIGFQK